MVSIGQSVEVRVLAVDVDAVFVVRIETVVELLVLFIIFVADVGTKLFTKNHSSNDFLNRQGNSYSISTNSSEIFTRN